MKRSFLSEWAVIAVVPVGIGMAAGSACGQTHIVSRLSTVSAFSDDGGPFSWDEHDSFSGPGAANLILPHGMRHSFSVLPAAFQGTFDGYYSVSNRIATGATTSLGVTFTVPLRTGIEVRLNGSVYPNGPGASNPAENNAYYHLVRTAPGPQTVVFDSFRDGSPTPPDPDHGQSWNNTVWTGVLTAGTYRLTGGASGVRVAGGAGTASGQGHLTVVTTLTPACPADFNGDEFLDMHDYADFVACFEGDECPGNRTADFNGDGFADFFDYADFVSAFEAGC